MGILKSIAENNLVSLPGHARSLHFCFCVLSPSQGLPPCNGAGLLQERSIVWTPPPQVTEHSDASDQSDHIPSTTMK